MIHSCNIRRNLFMRNKKLLLGIGIMCCLWCLPKIVHGKENKVSFSLVELKCENMVDPLGIDNVTPHLSWKLKGDGVVDGQAFYEIQVASDSLLLIGGKADLWKSGMLKSDGSEMVALWLRVLYATGGYVPGIGKGMFPNGVRWRVFLLVF